MSTLLDTRELARHFSVRETGFGRVRRVVRAVDGVDLALDDGDAMGVCGESGSGKTTLAYLLVGLLTPTAGTIRFRSREAGADGAKWIDLARASRREWRAYHRQVQIVFQNAEAALNPRRTVGASVADPLLVHGIASRRLARTAVADLLMGVGLDPGVARRFPSTLSAGQRQRVGIARALAVEPRLLICDEPVSSLDSSVQREILALLSSLRSTRRLTLLVIAHNLLVLRSTATRITVMYGGCFVEQAKTEDLFLGPLHPHTEKLLAAIPRIDDARAGDFSPRVAAETVMANNGGCLYRGACAFGVPACEETRPKVRDAAPGHAVACHRAGEIPLRSPF